MKKFLFLTLIFSALFSTSLLAQAGDQAAMLQQAKAKQIPLLVEKAGLTAAQADKVIEANFTIREASHGLRDMNEADRNRRIAELKVAKEKLYSDIPLTAQQIQSVYAAYESLRKDAPQRGN